MHRVCLGTDAGSLTLMSTHGPLVWCARPDFPRAIAGAHFGGFGPGPAGGSAPPSATVLGPVGAPSHAEVFQSIWTEGVVCALREVVHELADGVDPVRTGQYYLTLCQLWQDVTARLGPPELLRGAARRALGADELGAMRVAADG